MGFGTWIDEIEAKWGQGVLEMSALSDCPLTAHGFGAVGLVESEPDRGEECRKCLRRHRLGHRCMGLRQSGWQDRGRLHFKGVVMSAPLPVGAPMHGFAALGSLESGQVGLECVANVCIAAVLVVAGAESAGISDDCGAFRIVRENGMKICVFSPENVRIGCRSL